MDFVCLFGIFWEVRGFLYFYEQKALDDKISSMKAIPASYVTACGEFEYNII